MDNNIIGAQITKYRKAAGITQEELGKAAGVSTQAVSRWENGGAPDVTLLPAIADKLGVTIDALFGREGGKVPSIVDLVQAWARTLPQEQVFDRLNQLLWSGVMALPSAYLPALIPFPDSCYQLNMNGKYSDILSRSIFQTDNGFYFGVAGKDFSFSTLCPRPEAGYGAYLPEGEAVQRFLSLLSQPGCLEILTSMLRKEARYYSPELLAKELSMAPEKASAILGQLKDTGLVTEMEVGLLDGNAKVYDISETNSCALLMLLYLARCMADPHALQYVNLSFREKPLL